jgi:hypothetical protein
MKPFAIAALFTFSIVASIAQDVKPEIEPPSEGKAVVYFMRISSLGFAINFSYFHNDKFIGKFNGPKYMRYECEPGEQLFWGWSENRDFVLANLDTGKVYFIEAAPQMGGLKAQVQLIPIDPKDTKRMDKVFKLIAKKPSETFTESELAVENQKLTEDIAKGMEKYKEHTTNGKVARMPKEMYYVKK